MKKRTHIYKYSGDRHAPDWQRIYTCDLCGQQKRESFVRDPDDSTMGHWETIELPENRFCPALTGND